MVIALAAVLSMGLLGGTPAWARKKPTESTNKHTAGKKKARNTKAKAKQREVAPPGNAEARLIAVYRQIGQGNLSTAQAQAGDLVRDYPNFQLAQLVYGDLLSARSRPLQALGDVPASQLSASAAPALQDLRGEALQRLRALRERPPPHSVPSQLVALASDVRHAIAVDALRSRLYLFANSATGPQLIGDYYVSLGKLGLDKRAEGDARTPQGVYFITTNLDPRTLKDFYGGGALPINYPNVLDQQRGKTGKGIWLHGTPPEQFARAPLATDGCVVLANPDLHHLIRTVEIRSTPVIIANELRWVPTQTARASARSFEATLRAWQGARGDGNLAALQRHYSTSFQPAVERADTLPPAPRLRDASILRWVDQDDTMVVSYRNAGTAHARGPVQPWRQVWRRERDQWKIIYEGVNG